MLVLDGPLKRRPARFTGLNYRSPQAKGLVGWWPLLYTDGPSAVDRGPRGVYSLDPTSISWLTKEKYGKVPDFNGTSSKFLKSATLATTFPVTFTCIFRTESVSTFQTLISGANSSTNNVLFRLLIIDTGVLRAQFRYDDGTGLSNVESSVALLANTWYFAAAIFESDYTNVWIEGVRNSKAHTTPFPTLNNISLGITQRTSPLQFLNGQIADARAYARSLTDEELEFIRHDPWDLYAPERIMVPVPALAGGASGTTEIVIFESIPLSVTGSNLPLSASAETASFNSVILDCAGSNAVTVSTATNAPVGIVAQSITGDNAITVGTTSAAPAVGFIALDVSSFAGLSGVAETASATWQVISVTGGNMAESADAGSVTATWIALPVTGSPIKTSATANIAIASFVAISPTAFTGQQGVAETAQASWIAGQLTGGITAETATAEIVAFDILPLAADGTLSPKSSTADISAASFIALDPTAFVGMQSIADTAAADFRALDLSGQLSPPLTADATLATVEFFLLQPAGESPAETGTVATATMSVLALSPFSELAFVVGNDNAFQFVARATTFQMATRSRKFTIPR